VRQTQLVYIAGMLIGAAALVLAAVGVLRMLDVLTNI
jgi:multisubunit Na+/H+ antiporter MnhG subunit